MRGVTVFFSRLAVSGTQMAVIGMRFEIRARTETNCFCVVKGLVPDIDRSIVSA